MVHRYVVILAASALVATAGAARAQVAGIPDWIEPRSCADRSDLSACRGELVPDILYGRAPSNPNAGQDTKSTDTWPVIARCTYTHPDHPGWNFDDTCFFTEHSYVAATMTLRVRIGVRNGASVFLGSELSHDAPDTHRFNDLAATRQDVPGGYCHTAISTGERFCLLDAGQGAPARRAETGAAQQARTVAGYCLVTETNGPGIDLVSYGSCTLTESCQGSAATESSCVRDYDLSAGEDIRVSRAEDMRFLNDEPASLRDDGCIQSNEWPLRTLCFSQAPFSPDDHPVLRSANLPQTREGTCELTGAKGTGDPVACSELVVTGKGRFIYEWDGGSMLVNAPEDMLTTVDGQPVDIERSGYRWFLSERACVTPESGAFTFCFTPD